MMVSAHFSLLLCLFFLRDPDISEGCLLLLLLCARCSASGQFWTHLVYLFLSSSHLFISPFPPWLPKKLLHTLTSSFRYNYGFQSRGITYELNVSSSCPKSDWIQESHFLRIPVNDNHHEQLLPYFPIAFDFLDRVRLESIKREGKGGGCCSESSYLLNDAATCVDACSCSSSIGSSSSKGEREKIQTGIMAGGQMQDISCTSGATAVQESALIHCLAGVSRSATVAIGYLMYHSMTLDDSYRYVKSRRPSISPNFNFLGQLHEYEKQLQQKRDAEKKQQVAVPGNPVTLVSKSSETKP